MWLSPTADHYSQVESFWGFRTLRIRIIKTGFLLRGKILSSSLLNIIPVVWRTGGEGARDQELAIDGSKGLLEELVSEALEPSSDSDSAIDCSS